MRRREEEEEEEEEGKSYSRHNCYFPFEFHGIKCYVIFAHYFDSYIHYLTFYRRLVSIGIDSC